MNKEYNAYEQGKKDAFDQVMWMLEHFDYHATRKELIEKIKELKVTNTK